VINQINIIVEFMLASFLHIWPYLIISIPLAVAVNMSDAGKYINKVLRGKPMTAIILAVLVGAFSPFCSCGVIPIIAALLIGGVPLAPVMAFWVASPSMDPEIFFLSAGILGWELAIWRLVSTLFMSLAAGLITHFAMSKNLLGDNILTYKGIPKVSSTGAVLKTIWNFFSFQLRRLEAKFTLGNKSLAAVIPLGGNQVIINDPGVDTGHITEINTCEKKSCGSAPEGNNAINAYTGFLKRLARETYSASFMVIKFMALAFFLGALINIYIPKEFITGLLGGTSFLTVIMAAVLGVPVYTSNLTALPLIGGLINQGMNPAAGLAFLISGPTTTIPAMAAVWGLVNKKVFMLYVFISLFAAVFFGILYQLSIFI